MRFVLAALVGALALTGCATTNPAPSEMATAFRLCHPSTKVYSLEDDGTSIIVNGAMDYNFTDLGCLLARLGASDAIATDMDATTELMGRQSEVSGKYRYNWSYAPDAGLTMTITEK